MTPSALAQTYFCCSTVGANVNDQGTGMTNLAATGDSKTTSQPATRMVNSEAGAGLFIRITRFFLKVEPLFNLCQMFVFLKVARAGLEPAFSSNAFSPDLESGYPVTRKQGGNDHGRQTVPVPRRVDSVLSLQIPINVCLDP